MNGLSAANVRPDIKLPHFSFNMGAIFSSSDVREKLTRSHDDKVECSLNMVIDMFFCIAFNMALVSF